MPKTETAAEKAAIEAQEEADLQEEAKRVEKELADKAEAKRQARMVAKGTASEEKMFSEAQVKEMIKQVILGMKEKEGTDGADEDDEAFKQKQVRLPRIDNKFIFNFKNMNQDIEYFPDLVIHAVDVWDDKTQKMVPWVTIVFQDGTEKLLPLNVVLTRSTKLPVDLIEVIEKDTSYSAGRVEVADYQDYSRKGTGQFIKQKVKQSDYKFKVRLPDGTEAIVGKEVVNW